MLKRSLLLLSVTLGLPCLPTHAEGLTPPGAAAIVKANSPELQFFMVSRDGLYWIFKNLPDPTDSEHPFTTYVLCPVGVSPEQFHTYWLCAAVSQDQTVAEYKKTAGRLFGLGPKQEEAANR
jgi:hypothetical protein